MEGQEILLVTLVDYLEVRINIFERVESFRLVENTAGEREKKLAFCAFSLEILVNQESQLLALLPESLGVELQEFSPGCLSLREDFLALGRLPPDPLEFALVENGEVVVRGDGDEVLEDLGDCRLLNLEVRRLRDEPQQLVNEPRFLHEVAIIAILPFAEVQDLVDGQLLDELPLELGRSGELGHEKPKV